MKLALTSLWPRRKRRTQSNVCGLASGIVEMLEDRLLLSFTVEYQVASEWSTGYEASISITNESASIVHDWELQFDYPHTIKSIWNASLAERTGDTYRIVAPAWARDIAPGATMSFGYIGGRNGRISEPTNFMLNGVSQETTPTLPTISIGDVTIAEGDDGVRDAVVEVRLSEASAQTISAQVATANGTAVSGSDFAATVAMLTFAPGESVQTLAVPIMGDIVDEPDETFFVLLSSATNAVIADNQATVTIVDDDESASSHADVEFVVTSDWHSGFVASIVITNNGSAAIDDWELEFDFDHRISSIWSARMASHDGDHYVIQAV